MAQSSGILGGLADSPKKQRRLFIVSGVVFVAGLAAFLAMVVFHGTSNAFTDTFSNEPAQLSRPEKKVPISKQQIAIAREFIKTAVARKNLDKAWNITDVDLKGRMNKKQWMTGNIPVIYYDAINADRAAFVTDYSYETSALMEVDLIPKPHTQARPHLLFYLGLKREHGKKNGRWLVDYWQPNWRPPIPEAVH
jgi:hypothetical protein